MSYKHTELSTPISNMVESEEEGTPTRSHQGHIHVHWRSHTCIGGHTHALEVTHMHWRSHTCIGGHTHVHWRSHTCIGGHIHALEVAYMCIGDVTHNTAVQIHVLFYLLEVVILTLHIACQKHHQPQKLHTHQVPIYVYPFKGMSTVGYYESI